MVTNIRGLVRVLVAAALAVSGSFAVAQDAGFADELKDFGVSSTKYPRTRSAGYGTPTPTTIPGAKVVTTGELKELLESSAKPALAVVYTADGVIGDAMVMDGAGEDRLLGPDKGKFEKALAALTSGDKSRPLVFYCHGPKCWLSYNASLHAIAAGYTSVLWYRGGRDAWKEAKFKFTKPTSSW